MQLRRPVQLSQVGVAERGALGALAHRLEAQDLRLLHLTAEATAGVIVSAGASVADGEGTGRHHFDGSRRAFVESGETFHFAERDEIAVLEAMSRVIRNVHKSHFVLRAKQTRRMLFNNQQIECRNQQE